LKLSKRTLVIIAVGVFVIVFGVLGYTVTQLFDKQDELEEKYALSQSQLQLIQLEQLSKQQAELEDKLSQATSQFEAVQLILSEPKGSVIAAASLFEIAESYGLVVTEITSPGIAEEQLEGTPLSAVALTATIVGDVPDLVDFITTLNSYYTTGVVKSATINIPGDTLAENITASVQLVVYTYRED